MYACYNMLQSTVKMGCVSDVIYTALFLYSIGKNKDAISNLMMATSIIAQPHILHHCRREKQMYCDEVGGQELSEKIRRAFAINFYLGKGIIKELELAQRVRIQSFLVIPPFVLTLMLLVLCYRNDPDKQQEKLYDLYSIVHHDKDKLQFIPIDLRDISWQILGICQQICGDHQGALESFVNSLYQKPCQGI